MPYKQTKGRKVLKEKSSVFLRRVAISGRPSASTPKRRSKDATIGGVFYKGVKHTGRAKEKNLKKSLRG